MSRKTYQTKHEATDKNSASSSLWASVKSRWLQFMTISSGKECSYRFFFVGYFLLVSGIVLMVGFNKIGFTPSRMDWFSYTPSIMDWFSLLPHFILIFMILNLVLGLVLMRGGSTAIKAAKYGTYFYIFFITFNGALLWLHIHPPFVGTVSIIFFVAMNLLMASMLLHAVKQMNSMET